MKARLFRKTWSGASTPSYMIRRILVLTRASEPTKYDDKLVAKGWERQRR